jgi:hypothetical protein
MTGPKREKCEICKLDSRGDLVCNRCWRVFQREKLRKESLLAFIARTQVTQ